MLKNLYRKTEKTRSKEYSKLVLASTEELTTKKDGVSFQQFIEETYLPWYKTQVKESTYLNRATTIKKHFSYFYKMETDEIEPIHVQNWQLKLAKDFSPNYIRIVQGMLSIAFDRAVVLGIAKKNPSRMIGNIKSKKTKVDFWTLEEFQKVISLLCKKDYYEHYLFISFWLLFMTGMRIGEASALHWSDISLVNTQARPYGDSVIAGMGAVTRVVSMGSLMVFGFIKGFQPIAGYSYGAKKFDRLHEAIKTSIIWSTVFCVIYGLVLTVFSKGIISQFTKGDLEMIRVGTQSLRINGISFILFGFYTVYSSLFLALGKGLAGFILGACRQGICFVPVILILPAFWGINGILYVQPIADLLSAIITIFMALHLHKELTLTKQKFLSEKNGIK